MTRKNTMIEMVQELKNLPKHPEVLAMIENAKAGEYHDFKNVKYTCGKVASAEHLFDIMSKYPGTREIAGKIRGEIINGVYDESPDDDDKKEMDKLWNGL